MEQQQAMVVVVKLLAGRRAPVCPKTETPTRKPKRQIANQRRTVSNSRDPPISSAHKWESRERKASSSATPLLVQQLGKLGKIRDTGSETPFD
jgi:hypothetical protein